MIYCCCYISVAHLIMNSYHHMKFPCTVWESEIRLGFKIILGLAIVIKNYNLSSYLSTAREESSDVKVCFCKKKLQSAALLLAELLSCFALIGSLNKCFPLIGSQVAWAHSDDCWGLPESCQSHCLHLSDTLRFLFTSDAMNPYSYVSFFFLYGPPANIEGFSNGKLNYSRERRGYVSPVPPYGEWHFILAHNEECDHQMMGTKKDLRL